MRASGQGGKVGGAHDKHGDLPTDDLVAQMEDQESQKLAGSQGAESVKTAVFSKHHPETVRFFLLATHYRSPIDFSDERLEETARSLDGFYRLIETFMRITGEDFYSLEVSATRAQSKDLTGEPAVYFQELTTLRARFLECMDDDINTGGAVGVLFDLRKLINGFINETGLLGDGKSSDTGVAALVAGIRLLKELSSILGVFRQPVESAASEAGDELVGGLMELVISLRSALRAEKNWPLADQIRDSLNELNLTLEDGPDGTLWRRE